VDKLGYDIKKLSYILPTHVHLDHAGGAGHLSQQLPQSKVVAHVRAAKVLSEPSILNKLMQGFRHVFGQDAILQFGGMIPVAKEKFLLVEDGQTISLGNRMLTVIHTPGHDPNHLCFLDSKSNGLFCGDALGGYFSEVEAVIPSIVPGSDPYMIIKSIKKLREREPALLFFSHGGTTKFANKILNSFENNAQQCTNVALELMKMGADDDEVANSLADVLVSGSKISREDYLASALFFKKMVIAGYQMYFKKHDML